MLLHTDSPAQINRLHCKSSFQSFEVCCSTSPYVQILDNLLQEEHHVSVPSFHCSKIAFISGSGVKYTPELPPQLQVESDLYSAGRVVGVLLPTLTMMYTYTTWPSTMISSFHRSVTSGLFYYTLVATLLWRHKNYWRSIPIGKTADYYKCHKLHIYVAVYVFAEANAVKLHYMDHMPEKILKMLTTFTQQNDQAVLTVYVCWAGYNWIAISLNMYILDTYIHWHHVIVFK